MTETNNATYYWDYAIGNDEPSESEFASEALAIGHAQHDFVQGRAEGDSPREPRTEICLIMRFYYDENNERVINFRKWIDVEYEYQPSDAEEHGTWG